MTRRRVNTIAQLAAAAKAARLAHGWTQEELATRIGSSRLWVIQFEAGKPTAESGYVLRVLNVLGIELVAEMPEVGLRKGASE